MRKKNKNLSEISFRDVKAYFQNQRYKIKKDISDFSSLPDKIFQEMDPVFVVSTGRAGSEMLVRLMKKAGMGSIFHEPHPRMFLGSRLAYEMGPGQSDAKKMAFLNARYFLLKNAYLQEERFIETNNRTTFFMDAIAEIFPNAKFIHLIRHPGAFVRSGLRRNYYTGNENDDGRLTPREHDPAASDWENITQMEKIAWLWNETNAFIEEKKTSLDIDRVLTVHANDLFTDPDNFQTICNFLNHPELDRDQVEHIIKKPVNKQKQGQVGKWDTWPADEIALLKKWTPLGKHYGFWSESV